MSATVKHLNPEGLHHNPAFTQAVAVQGDYRLVYVGGQNAVNAAGAIVGQGDIAAQAEQVAANLETALAAAGATPQHVVKWNIYVVTGQPIQAASMAFQKRWGAWENPPAISVLFVAGLAHPDFLLEIDAVAVVPTNE